MNTELKRALLKSIDKGFLPKKHIGNRFCRNKILFNNNRSIQQIRKQ